MGLSRGRYMYFGVSVGPCSSEIPLSLCHGRVITPRPPGRGASGQLQTALQPIPALRNCTAWLLTVAPRGSPGA